MLAEWLLFLFAISTIIIPGYHAGLQELSIPDSSSVTERTMKSILESCYNDDSSSDTVLVLGDFNEYTDKLPMIQINDFTNLRPDSLSNFKINRVIFVVDSPQQIWNYIELFKSHSTTATIENWNNMASFFIILKNKNPCYDNIDDIFRLTWEQGMINTIYICPEKMNTAVLYTMNSYANYAPHPWKIIGIYVEASMFTQRFDSKNISCSTLNYDKTKILKNHIIKVSAYEFPVVKFHQMRNWTTHGGTDNIPKKIINSVAEALNGTCKLIMQTGDTAAIEILNVGGAHLTMDPSSIEEYPNRKFFFPHDQERIVAVIKLSSEESTQSKILHLWSYPVIILAFIALVILFLILSWINHEFSSALLDVIRLIIYSSILTNIRSHSFRIFFTTILIMMIISNGVFQGKIAAFLTAKERNRPIEKIETLIKFGYKLYSTPGLHKIIRSHCPECHTKTVTTDECLNHVLNDRLTACLTKESSFLQAASMPLDLVKEPLLQTLLVIKCRNNWPLYDRINDMWMRVFESGLPNFWQTQQNHKALQERRLQDMESTSTEYQPIKLYKLLFFFKFWAICLFLSTIVFIAELLMN